jgi:hypothetical protein
MKSNHTLHRGANKNPIEAVFTEHEINREINYVKDTGYYYNHPPRWITTLSDNKMIGVRRLDMFPTSHVFNLQFAIYSTYNDKVEYDPIWILHFESAYSEKPDIWTEGSFYRGPVFDQELSGSSGKFEKVVIDKMLSTYKVHAHMFLIRYDLSYDPDKKLYKTAIYFRRSLVEYENNIYIT